MIRRAVALVLLALVVLLVIADRLTESATAHALAVRARQTGLLASDPAVVIRGFPFLTQAFRGRYDEIDVTTHGIHRGGLRIDTVIAHFHGVHVGLVAALDGSVAKVPIDRADGEADITYADLDAFLATKKLRLTATATGVQIAGASTVGGTRIPISGPVTVTVAQGVLALTPAAATLRGPAGALPAAAAATVAAAYTVRVPLIDLPFGLRLQTLSLQSTGLRITAAATGLTVPVPSDASQG